MWFVVGSGTYHERKYHMLLLHHDIRYLFICFSIDAAIAIGLWSITMLTKSSNHWLKDLSNYYDALAKHCPSSQYRECHDCEKTDPPFTRKPKGCRPLLNLSHAWWVQRLKVRDKYWTIKTIWHRGNPQDIFRDFVGCFEACPMIIEMYIELNADIKPTSPCYRNCS